MSGPDLLLVFFLRSCVCNHSFSLSALPSPGLCSRRYSCRSSVKDPSDDAGKSYVHVIWDVTVVLEHGGDAV